MRQTTMDRWIEAAEARRVSQIAQEEWAQPPRLDAAARFSADKTAVDGDEPGPYISPRFASRDTVGCVGAAHA